MIPTLQEKHDMQELLIEKIQSCSGGDYPVEEVLWIKILLVLTEADTL